MSTVHPSKTAIVTGGSRGIGRAVCLRLARDGFALVVNYHGNTESAEAVVGEIEALGGRAIAVKGDVAEPGDVEQLFARAKEMFGTVGVVVHSAGIMLNTSIAELDLEAFDKTVRTNLRGAYVVLGQAARDLEAGGRIIALSSSVLGKSFPTYGPYIATKAGVEGLVRVLANELRGKRIAVNAVAPGPVGTELFYSGKSEEQIATIKNLAPLEPRLATPEEIADAVAFLAGPESGWINAQVLRVNGGMA